jgi:phosphoribosyl 1,2-cyclic phosphodiesterase
VRLALLGVRGSTPSPGHEFAEVGGNTACVAIGPDDGVPRLVLDAGTGLRRLTGQLAGAAFAGTILLTHLHWDHLQGLPFFAAADRDDARVRLCLPEQGDAMEVLRRAMSPPHFPIGPEGLRGDWTFDGLAPGRHLIEGFEVLACPVAHKGGLTFGYRISDGSATVAYLPDHALTRADLDGADQVGGSGRRSGDAAGLRAGAEELIDGVDVLIHDAQFTEAEEAVARDYGHATVEAALALARRGRVGRLVLFHHAPGRRDAEVVALGDALAQAGQAPDGGVEVAVEVGTESTVIVLGGSNTGEAVESVRLGADG